MIYNACQIGININITDLSLHTLMAVNEYASKIIGEKDETPSVDISTLRRMKAMG